MAIETNSGLQRLLDGNQRFVEGRTQLHEMTAFGIEVAAGQNPFAVVLGCSDSRVPIETIFDQEPGNVFVIRVAGNLVNDDGLGSMEYSFEMLKSTLILVLGHSGCGAVAAAMQQVNDGSEFPGHIARLVSSIAPAAVATRGSTDHYRAAVEENVRRNASAITERSPMLANAVRERRLTIAGAVYDLSTGKVTLVET